MNDQSIVRTIVRIRARQGCDSAFVAAWQRAAAEISGMPGNVGQQLLREESDPRVFMIVADWADQASADAFGRSDRSEHLVEALRGLGEDVSRTTFAVVESLSAEPARPVRVARIPDARGHRDEEQPEEADDLSYHVYTEWESEQRFLRWAEDPAHRRDGGGRLPGWPAVDPGPQLRQVPRQA